ncbi:hypothetical protein E2C01_090730 [Portunus trituberculatus]|uniref:Uncharacterized protein n=1 Tax=Portunus trituberculatus TaxID=210409 RepID=A0A5B7JT73_PORTR|nr:hypothetical protein [Portunus trituberculatus]
MAAAPGWRGSGEAKRGGSGWGGGEVHGALTLCLPPPAAGPRLAPPLARPAAALASLVQAPRGLARHCLGSASSPTSAPPPRRPAAYRRLPPGRRSPAFRRLGRATAVAGEERRVGGRRGCSSEVVGGEERVAAGDWPPPCNRPTAPHMQHVRPAAADKMEDRENKRAEKVCGGGAEVCREGVGEGVWALGGRVGSYKHHARHHAHPRCPHCTPPFFPGVGARGRKGSGMRGTGERSPLSGYPTVAPFPRTPSPRAPSCPWPRRSHNFDERL